VGRGSNEANEKKKEMKNEKAQLYSFMLNKP
jgi:hypothetical protein